MSRLGRYELIAPIGRGGMADVHLAHEGVEKLVVVKIVQDLEEGRLAGMIKHPNVVEIYEVGEDAGRSFIAMEYLAGEPLLSLLRAGADGERLDALSTARVIADAAEGLEAVHRLKGDNGKPLGLVHHDISLGNVVVLDTGGVKIVDFGVAKRTKDKRERIVGKLAYIAPEKLVEGAEVDRRSDIWSLGVVAWEALTLTRLFAGETDGETIAQVRELPIRSPSEVNPDVPAELDPIVMRALERDVAKRYSTAKAFASDLAGVLRKHGYGGKQERIAKYMRRAFPAQVAARERLAAALRAGKVSPELVVAFKPAEPERADVALPEPKAAGAQVYVARRVPPIAWAIGGGALLVLVVAWRCRGGEPQAPAHALPASIDTPAMDAPAVRAPSPDAAIAIAVDAAIEPPIDASASEIEIAVEREVPKPKPPRPPDDKPRDVPKPPADPYARGLEQLRTRDYQAALASLDEARRASPNHAPTWHALGRTYEAVGNRGAAKNAYLRYLTLAPRAANAQQVRDRLSRL